MIVQKTTYFDSERIKKLIIKNLHEYDCKIDEDFSVNIDTIIVNISYDDEKENEVKCDKCGGWTRESRERIDGDEDDDCGGYWQDVFTCKKCGHRQEFPD